MFESGETYLNCITTMVSGWYKHFIPMFEYSAKRAMPDVDVKVFSMEKLFPEYNRSSVNSLRFFIPKKLLKNYNYVYFTDVDFVFLPHNKDLFDYHIQVANATAQGYSGHRGPIRAKKRGFKNWSGKHTRIAAGAFMVNREWFDRTEKIKAELLPSLVTGVKYRESDEMMLHTILRESKYRTPLKVGRFADNRKYNIRYRDVHLGDFKGSFTRWKDIKRMKRKFLTNENVKAYSVLSRDREWRHIVDKACQNHHIKRIMDNLDFHIKKRLRCISS